MNDATPSKKRYFAWVLTCFIFIVILYPIGGWLTIVGGLALIILPSRFRAESLGSNQTLKLVIFAIVILLLGFGLAYLYILTHMVPLPTAN
ncbi:MAG: hypothetical protein ABI947_07595 [Chloroflexota bacterium]